MDFYPGLHRHTLGALHSPCVALVQFLTISHVATIKIEVTNDYLIY